MILDLVKIGASLLDKVIPDPEQRRKAKAELIELQQQGKLQETEQQLSVILAEAKSADPWTSRARPSFLYVVYVIILSALPMGGFYAYDPVAAGEFVKGFQMWLAAIPESMWTLFGVGYLGYTGARSFDKTRLKK